jgi:selenocysteine lyase/cysteine desulfurase
MTAAAPSPIARDQLIGLEDGRVHLCTGSEAPLPRTMLEAFTQHARARAEGAAGRAGFEAMLTDLRQRMAALLGDPAHPERVAFLSSASHALDTVARLLPWQAGDGVVTLADEFPSVMLSWAPAWARGAVLHAVEPAPDPEQALLDAVRPDTRVVCVSHVSYRTSLRLDLARLSQALRPRGVLLVVDASHSLGVIQVPIQLCDAVVSCGHKFLMGLHGTGILHLGDRIPRTDAPLGWYGVTAWAAGHGRPAVTPKAAALSLELGNPAFLTLSALLEGLRLLEAAGPERVEQHAMALSGYLREGLAARGLPLLTPADPLRRGTSIAIPDPIGADLHRALAARRILATGNAGRLRISCHGYTTRADIDAVLAAVDETIPPSPTPT